VFDQQVVEVIAPVGSKFNPLKDFDFLPENWSKWISPWSSFDKEDRVQIDKLLYSMEPRAELILFSSHGLTVDEVKVAFYDRGDT